jgi:hypothetical protein
MRSEVLPERNRIPARVHALVLVANNQNLVAEPSGKLISF